MSMWFIKALFFAYIGYVAILWVLNRMSDKCEKKYI